MLHVNTVSLSLSFSLFRTILGRSGVLTAQAVVMEITTGCGCVWVGTRGGHLMAFNPLTFDILLVHQRQTSVTTIVCLSEREVVTFGEGVIGERSEEGEVVTTGMFTVWRSFIDID